VPGCELIPVRPPDPHPGARLATTEVVEAFLSALLAVHRERAEEVVVRLVEAGWSADDLRLGLIAPTLHEVGERWARGELGVGDEHLATGMCDWLLSELSGWSPPPPAVRGTAVVGCSADELHGLGARVVADMLREHGWRVLYLGAATPPDALEGVVRARRPALVALSTSRREGLPQVSDAIERVRGAAPGCLIAVGGQAYVDPDRDRALVRADVVEPDARRLLARLG
jgi:methanogenic corrinoid protein MtbC1